MLKLAFMAGLITVFLILPAYAEISISTDKKFYQKGDIVTIFGIGEPPEVEKKIPKGLTYEVNVPNSMTAHIAILNPFDNLIHASHVNPNNVGVFSDYVRTDTALWKDRGLPGLYTVIVTQNYTRATDTYFCFESNDCIFPDQDYVSANSKKLSSFIQLKNDEAWVELSAIELSNDLTLKGHAPLYISYNSSPITFSVRIPNGNVVFSTQVIPDTNGDFRTTVPITSQTRSIDGLSTVNVVMQENGNQHIFSFQIETISGKIINIFPLSSAFNGVKYAQGEVDTIEEILQVFEKDHPQWIENILWYWEQGDISNHELFNAIKFLIGSGVIED